MSVIINPLLPLWVRNGEKRPPECMKKYFPKEWEEEFMKYGDPSEVGKYFAEEIMKDVRDKLCV